MALASSTQLISDDLSPQELQNHLHFILQNVLTPGVSIKSDGRTEMVTLLRDLCQIMMGEFPRVGVAEWHLLKDRIQIIDTSLNLIDRALICVEGILGKPDELEHTILAQFFALSGNLEEWLAAVHYEDHFINGPTYLQSRLRSVVLNVFAVLCGKSKDGTGSQPRPDYSSLSVCLEECLRVAKDLPLNFVEPHLLALFKKDRMASEESGIPIILQTSAARDSLFANALYLAIHGSLAQAKLGVMSDIPLRAAKIACLNLSTLLKDANEVPCLRRICVISRLLEAISPLFTLPPLINSTNLLPLVRILVTKRQAEGPHTKWSRLDGSLARLLESVPVGTRMETNMPWFEEVIELRKAEGDVGSLLEDMLFTYIHINLAILNEDSIKRISSLLLRPSPSLKLTSLLFYIQERLAGRARCPPEFVPSSLPIRLNELHRNILCWFFPGDPDSIPPLGDMGEIDWCMSIIQEVAKRVTELFTPHDENYLQVLKRFAELPCVMVHEGAPKCSGPLLSGISFIPAFTEVGQHLLHLSGSNHSPALLRCLYQCLAGAVKHQSPNIGGDMDSLLALLKHGLKQRDRSVRIKAGHILVDVLLIPSSDGIDRATPILRMMNEILSSDSLEILETALITIGDMGRATELDILGGVLQCIINKLGHQNPIIKGLAYMQLLNLNRHHGKGPYGLLAPYLPSISVEIVPSISFNSEHLLQICNFLGMVPGKFYNLTLVHFLPHLVCECNGDALIKVAKELRKSPVSLITSHDVLARVFLLSGQHETDKVFKFILNFLAKEKGSTANQITALMLVKSTIVPLLGEIVIAMGEASHARQARDAILKVDKMLSSERHGQSSLLIHEYMMGIVSHLNEVLQEVHGKRPLEIKKKVICSLGALIKLVGWQIAGVAPQIMATMQSMLVVPCLAEETLESWHTFIITLSSKDVGPYIGPTSAAFVTAWLDLNSKGRGFVKMTLNYLICDSVAILQAHYHEFVSLDSIKELEPYSSRLRETTEHWSIAKRLDNILTRVISDNLTVAAVSLQELKVFMTCNEEYILQLASGDIFDPVISRLISNLWEVSSRDGDGSDILHSLAYDCIGRLGAVDPDRLELVTQDPSMILYHNFEDDEESNNFAVYLIRDVLVGTYRSTSDIKFQSHLAFAIQELLKFCGFSKELVSSAPTNAVSVRTRNRWKNLRRVWEFCVPLLEAKYARTVIPIRTITLPIYPGKSTYREWMQDWTAHLIDKVSSPRAKMMFNVFRAVVVDKDVGVARHILPHLVLHILISGTDADAQNIQLEIITVLKDQVNPLPELSADRRLLCAQSIFMLMDHLNKWIRAVRQDISQRRSESRRSRTSDLLREYEHNLVKVDSVLANIDHELVAKAAFECKAFARSLMSFERQIQILQVRGIPNDNADLQAYYEKLHEIYSHLDEPDGMEGVTSRVLDPSLEHQIRQHESTGRWTSAQSCWELRLQESPNNLDFHLGLMRCLRNLGHYDTLRTHIKGILSRNPHWRDALNGFQAEAAWIVGDWDSVKELSRFSTAWPCPEIILARLLLAMREEDALKVSEALAVARSQLGAPIHAAGRGAYRRVYESVLSLHLVRDAELIHEALMHKTNNVRPLSRALSRRFESTLPSFRIREPILSLQRTALSLREQATHNLKPIIGNTWLATSKIARKAGHGQTAYSAVLQARRMDAPFTFLQDVKLVKAIGEPTRALQELDKALVKFAKEAENEIIDLTKDSDPDVIKMKAKAQILRAQWMYDVERHDKGAIHRSFKDAVNLAPSWESVHFHLGNFYDRQFAQMPTAEKEAVLGRNLNYETIKSYGKTLQAGSKYVYQTMPRLLTLWLDLGEKDDASDSILHRTNTKINATMRSIAVYKWLTAFPQIVSRIDHPNSAVFDLLSSLIVKVLGEYPHQGTWLFISVVQSKKPERNRRGEMVIQKLISSANSTSVVHVVNQCRSIANEFLKLCSYPVTDEPRSTLSMAKLFPGLTKLVPSQLIVPLQESLIASLPSESSLEGSHQPFPHDLPTITKFEDTIEVMKSLAKPRKITLQANNGRFYSFLGKPKDDLRKDARLMDFNAMINKLLKKNSDSRRRQLHIRTYSVVTLNEESGLIQWVPNTIPMRPALLRFYDMRNISTWSPAANQAFARLKELPSEQAAEYFVREILSKCPPVFHEWFIDTFPEPSVWLASRLSFARTAAVMSMVGFILGLGDRHAENILLDINSGSVVHVDFDCLFERGKRLETPEKVPFRLTQNMQDGLGVTDVEGPFRIACEITMCLLRRNKDCLMSVLDAFIHDPLVEWEDEKKRMEKQRKSAAQKRRGHVNLLKEEVDLRKLAKDALLPIQKKLQGIYSPGDGRDDGKEVSTSNLVDVLIQEARSNENLAKMYPGWAPFL